MSDIFISYAREDRKTAQRLAEALEAQGWSVWWDTRLQAREVWDEVIERELAAARCVVVLWSNISVQKYWVRAEAGEGLRREILVPVRIENVEPPLAFPLVHAGDLIDWKDHRGHPGFKQLMANVTELLGVPPRAWKAADFDRQLAPSSFPMVLAEAIAFRQQRRRAREEEETARKAAEAEAHRRDEAPVLGPVPSPADAADAAPPSSILLKVIIYSVIAALTVIGLETLGVKILPFFNMTRRGNTEKAGGSDGSETTYSVECSVFAPPEISVGDWIMVQIFLHPPDIADTVEEAARLLDGTAALRGFSSLSLRLRDDARVGFQLEVPDLSVSDDGLGETSWHNRITGVQFLVSAPKDCKPGPRPATLRIFVEGIPAGRIHFLISVERETLRYQPEPRGDAARNYRKAFISYASEDRVEVLKRVQTLSALRIGFFQDLLSLEPGEHWERTLYLYIDQSDLFLLFWSTRARRSVWVGKEIAYALGRQKLNPDGEPDIVPVIIEGPPPPPPPKELAHLHFNDRLIYFMRGSAGTDLGEQQNP